ncbi:MAG: hypothetical protein HC880_13090 [Bacteroidia bacterium]|nr:hypothetical protein [Bacteroidia bacterium]
MVPVLAFSSHFALKRNWRAFFRWEWLVGLAIVALMISPMAIGLYRQFDLHPEKVVNQRTGVSGLYFYFWEQSFGRLTGENVWKDDSDVFFFVHTFVWSFLPWSFLCLMGLYQDLARLVSGYFKMAPYEEGLSLGGFVLPFVALSVSQYKLPHYIYVFFPLGAIIAAKFLYRIVYGGHYRGWYRLSWGLQGLTVVVLWGLAVWLVSVAFPMRAPILWIVAVLLMAGSIYALTPQIQPLYRILLPGWAAIVGVNILLNAHIYPALFQYQSGGVAARYARYELGIPPERLFAFSADYFIYQHSLDFYSARPIGGYIRKKEDVLKLSQNGKLWLYTDAKGFRQIRSWGHQEKVLRPFDRFHISKLTPRFLDPATRPELVQKVYLVEFVWQDQ